MQRFLLFVVVVTNEILQFVEVGCDLDHPNGLHFDYVTHVFLGSEDKLVVDHAFGLIFVEH